MQNITEEKTPIVEIANLSVHFGHFCALENLSFRIESGQIYGLIGPNGAGKTTTINAILGLVNVNPNSQIKLFGKQTSGQLKYCAHRVGYMPQDITLYTDISISQNLRFFGKLYGLPKKELKKNISEVLDLVDLDKFADRIISKCSGGMQRRASLACALLHKPDLLILDEPTVGIDPELRLIFWDYFRTLSKEGKTILITTHYLAESIKCDKVGFLRRSLITEGSPEMLQKSVQLEQNLSELPNMEDVFIFYTKSMKKVEKLEVS
ncbi:ABC transporter ATP-binding protein [Candidatus Harpocratesius sp.]